MPRPLLLVLVSLFALVIRSSENASHEQLFAFTNKLPPSLSKLLWYKSMTLGNIDAAERLLRSAKADEDDYWLTQIAQSAMLVKQLQTNVTQNHDGQSFALFHAQAAYTLAMRARSDVKQIYWLKKAADYHHAESQFELSLLLKNDKERLRLLTASAKQGYAPAVITLAKYYHQNLAGDLIASKQNVGQDNSHSPREQQELALYWLEQSSEYDAQSAFDLATMHWQAGRHSNAKQAFEQAVSLGLEHAKDYLSVITQQSETSIFDIFVDDEFATAKSKPACLQQLQFVAGTLDTVVKANQIKAKFEKDTRFDDMPICINPVVWLAPEILSCQSQASNKRINCNLSAFATIRKKPDFTHLVVFAQTGKAYVQRGVMYLDQADEYSVFVHELAHFAAFVDEYALSEPMARVHCGSAGAPNLMMENEEGKLNDAKIQRWQRATPVSLSIAPSRTCENYDRASFKPSADITFLEHHDTEYIPDIYLSLWQQQLEDARTQPHAISEFLYLAKRANNAKNIAHWEKLVTF